MILHDTVRCGRCRVLVWCTYIYKGASKGLREGAPGDQQERQERQNGIGAEGGGLVRFSLDNLTYTAEKKKKTVPPCRVVLMFLP